MACSAPIYSENEPLPVPEPIPAPETVFDLPQCNVNGNCRNVQVRVSLKIIVKNLMERNIRLFPIIFLQFSVMVNESDHFYGIYSVLTKTHRKYEFIPQNKYCTQSVFSFLRLFCFSLFTLSSIHLALYYF